MYTLVRQSRQHTPSCTCEFNDGSGPVPPHQREGVVVRGGIPPLPLAAGAAGGAGTARYPAVKHRSWKRPRSLMAGRTSLALFLATRRQCLKRAFGSVSPPAAERRSALPGGSRPARAAGPAGHPAAAGPNLREGPGHRPRAAAADGAAGQALRGGSH